MAAGARLVSRLVGERGVSELHRLETVAFSVRRNQPLELDARSLRVDIGNVDILTGHHVIVQEASTGRGQ